MTSITFFDNLADLPLIEIFSYLSYVDVLWAFTHLNRRLTDLLIEQGFFRHVNLSSVRRRKFDALLRLLRLDEIESLVIDNDGSLLQVTRWIYLPRLTTLRLRGVRNLNIVLIFLLYHADTLTHLSITINYRFTLSDEISTDPWTSFVENILLCHLPVLRSLDLGTDQFSSIDNWHFTTIPISLTYLRVVLNGVDDLFRIVLTRPLSDTLRQLHATVGDCCRKPDLVQNNLGLLPRMIHLHTFTFAEVFLYELKTDWTIVDALTCSSVMPVLQRVKLSLVIGIDDLEYIGQSSLFNDNRHVDVQFALCLNNDRSHAELTKYVPQGPRQKVGVTFLANSLLDTILMDDRYFRQGRQDRQHLWYTIPWAFDNFICLTVGDDSIRELQTFTSSPTTTMIGSSRLRILEAFNDVIPPSICSWPHALAFDRIEQLHLFNCNRSIPMTLPTLRHISLTNCLQCLNSSSSFPSSVRSIQIILLGHLPDFVPPDWTALNTLSTLPTLRSLRLLCYDIDTILDDTICQIIAQSVSMLTDFAFFLVRRGNRTRYAFSEQCTKFVEQIRHCILRLSLDQPPYELVEHNGHGLTMWF